MVLSETRLGICVLLALSVAGAKAAPFPSSDQNPLLGGLSVTAPARLADAGQTSMRLSFDWSSTAAIQQAGSDALVVDAESREWRLHLEHAFNEKLSLRAQLPYRTIDGGSLDSTIERWHGWFGLPDGDRPALQRDQLRIYYRQGNTFRFDYRDTSLSGIGDLSVDLGWQLHKTPSGATSLWTGVIFPTGDADNLTGTDGFAATLIVAHTQTLGKYFELFAHLGANLSNADGPAGTRKKNALWLAMLGADYRATERLTFTLQLDGHTAAFDAHGLDLLGPAYLLTVGADYRLPAQWRVQFGVVEDVKVEASPDVTFTMNAGKQWK